MQRKAARTEEGVKAHSSPSSHEHEAGGWFAFPDWDGLVPRLLLPWCKAEDGETGMSDGERKALKHLPVNWTEVGKDTLF